MYIGRPPKVLPEDDPREDRTERIVQEHLSKHLHLLQLGPLSLVGMEVNAGKVGRMDILASDGQRGFVVVEVKRDAARREAIGQLLAYMGELTSLRQGDIVRGAIVAAGIDVAAAGALRMTPNIVFLDYRAWFEASDLEPNTGAGMLPAGWSRIPSSWLGRHIDLEEAKRAISATAFAKLINLMNSADHLQEFKAKHPFGANSGIALVRAGRGIACIVTSYGIV